MAKQKLTELQIMARRLATRYRLQEIADGLGVSKRTVERMVYGNQKSTGKDTMKRLERMYNASGLASHKRTPKPDTLKKLQKNIAHRQNKSIFKVSSLKDFVYELLRMGIEIENYERFIQRLNDKEITYFYQHKELGFFVISNTKLQPEKIKPNNLSFIFTQNIKETEGFSIDDKAEVYYSYYVFRAFVSRTSTKWTSIFHQIDTALEDLQGTKKPNYVSQSDYKEEQAKYAFINNVKFHVQVLALVDYQ